MALRAKRDCNVCQYYWAALSLSFAESLFFMDIIAWSPQVSVNIIIIIIIITTFINRLIAKSYNSI